MVCLRITVSMIGNLIITIKLNPASKERLSISPGASPVNRRYFYIAQNHRKHFLLARFLLRPLCSHLQPPCSPF